MNGVEIINTLVSVVALMVAIFTFLSSKKNNRETKRFMGETNIISEEANRIALQALTLEIKTYIIFSQYKKGEGRFRLIFHYIKNGENIKKTSERESYPFKHIMKINFHPVIKHGFATAIFLYDHESKELHSLNPNTPNEIEFEFPMYPEKVWVSLYYVSNEMTISFELIELQPVYGGFKQPFKLLGSKINKKSPAVIASGEIKTISDCKYSKVKHSEMLVLYQEVESEQGDTSIELKKLYEQCKAEINNIRDYFKNDQ